MSSIVPPSVAARLSLILVVLVLATAILPAAATAYGPFDGSYQLFLTNSGVTFLVYLMVVQDGENIGVVFLAPWCSEDTIACQSPTWNYGQGFPTAGVFGQYSGNTLAANGNQVGTFTLQFSGDSVTATTTTPGSLPSTGGGTRFWGGNPAP